MMDKVEHMPTLYTQMIYALESSGNYQRYCEVISGIIATQCPSHVGWDELPRSSAKLHESLGVGTPHAGKHLEVVLEQNMEQQLSNDFLLLYKFECNCL